MKKSLLSIGLLTSLAFSADYWNIVKTPNSFSLDTVKSSVNKVYFANETGLLKIYDASSSFNFALTSTVADSLYILNANSASDIADMNMASGGSTTKECEISLVKGFNVVSLPTMELSNNINGASIDKVYATISGLLKIYDANSQFNFALTSTEEGSYYIVNASSASTGTCNTEELENPPSTPDLNTTDTTDDSIGLPPQVPSV